VVVLVPAVSLLIFLSIYIMVVAFEVAVFAAKESIVAFFVHVVDVLVFFILAVEKPPKVTWSATRRPYRQSS
jgi:hypothetical protein